MDVIGLDCEPVDELPIINDELPMINRPGIRSNVLQKNEPQIVQPQRCSTRLRKPNRHYSYYVMDK